MEEKFSNGIEALKTIRQKYLKRRRKLFKLKTDTIINR